MNNSNSTSSSSTASPIHPSLALPGASSSTSNKKTQQELEKELATKFASRIVLDPLYGIGNNLGSGVVSDIKTSSRKADSNRNRLTDKSDRATVEQVLDPRTRMILFKLLNRELISEINGCVSTGKEANVYHATTPENEHIAIKIYKTSILTFKDRDRYVTGEYRFRHGYSKSNPRKMVKVWAEKEMRNLKRLNIAGIPSPQPILLRSHVLLMTFIGKGGWAAPRLKDAILPSQQAYLDAYFQLIMMTWKMYHQCRLVHADLSEYNLLYHSKKLYIIDVSQSVEHDHPHALEFLRKDCANIIAYFGKRVDIPVLTLRELFDFIVSPIHSKDATTQEHETNPLSITDEEIMECVRQRHDEIKSRPKDYVSGAVQVDEEVFKKTYIPRTLDELVDVEKEVDNATSGKDVLYRSIAGLKMMSANEVKVGNDDANGEEEYSTVRISFNSDDDDTDSSEEAEEDEEEDDEEGSENEDEDEESDDDDDFKKTPRGKRNEDKDAKKLRKQQIKEEKREKRKTKVPKAVKKRKEKVGKEKKK